MVTFRKLQYSCRVFKVWVPNKSFKLLADFFNLRIGGDLRETNFSISLDRINIKVMNTKSSIISVINKLSIIQ